MKMGLELRLGLKCPVCKKLLPDPDDGFTAVAIFGAANVYAACPNCSHEMLPDEQDDQEYRRRVRVWMFQNKGVVVKEVF